MATLAELQAQDAEIVQAMRDAVTTGSQFSFVGSHQTTNQALKELRLQRKYVRRQMRSFKGIAGKSTPNYSRTASDPEQPPAS